MNKTLAGDFVTQAFAASSGVYFDARLMVAGLFCAVLSARLVGADAGGA
jgi:hypothetical protein